MDRDRHPVCNCEMRHEFGRPTHPAEKRISLDHERGRAEVCAASAGADGCYFDWRRNTQDRQSAFNHARETQRASTLASRADVIGKTPAPCADFQRSVRQKEFGLSEYTARVSS